jgi:glucokinase
MTTTKTTTAVYLMTGDIGGTNSRMSLYASHTSCGHDEPLFQKTFRNHEALPEHVRSDPNAFIKYIIIPFLEYCWTQENKNKTLLVPLNECTIFGCLATAGIVNENKVEMTNLGNLRINGNSIPCYHKYKSEMDDAALLNNPYLSRIVQCHIVNDFVAQGYGCLTLTESDVQHLYGPNDVSPQDLKKGPKVCVGAGTGLGECYLTQSGGMGLDAGMYTVRTTCLHVCLCVVVVIVTLPTAKKFSRQ